MEPLIIKNCPAIYEYYDKNNKKDYGCYKYKATDQEYGDCLCKDQNGCLLKHILQEYTYEKGTIWNALKAERVQNEKYE